MNNENSQDKNAFHEGQIEDPLTGVASRRYLIIKGGQDISLAKRHQESVSLLQFEIDEFKAVYNQYGDEVADHLLVWVATTLKSLCRNEDVVSRISGTAFAILAPRTTAAQALQMCTRLRTAVLDRAFVHNDIRLPVTFSIGVSVFGRDEGDDVEGLLKIAAHRASEARQHGGNSVVAEVGNVVALAANMEAMPVVAKGTTAKQTPASASATGRSLTLEQALELLNSHQREQLQPHIAGLIHQFMPLLEYGNKELNLSLGFAIEAMRKRLNEVAIEREFGDD